MDVGCLIMYMYMQPTKFEVGGDSPSWPYVKKIPDGNIHCIVYIYIYILHLESL